MFDLVKSSSGVPTQLGCTRVLDQEIMFPNIRLVKGTLYPGNPKQLLGNPTLPKHRGTFWNKEIAGPDSCNVGT